MSGAAIVWFRNDLRLADNPALHAACASGAPVLCLYILDDTSRGVRPLGGAARWWLHHSLEALRGALEKRGASLAIVQGSATEIIKDVVAAAKPSGVYWNRRYEPAEIDLDRAIKAMLIEDGIACETFNGALLYEPWEIATSSGGPFRVYTPFWRAARAKRDPAQPLPAPRKIHGAPWQRNCATRPIALTSLKLTPAHPNWAKAFPDHWTPGEDGARQRIGGFLDESLTGYAKDRDRPDKMATSRLSPHLRFGDVSPRQIWRSAQQHALPANRVGADIEKFLSELGWREFSYHLLYYFPDLAKCNFQRRFDALDWRQDDKAFDAWTKGLTGYPIVDAGMRQLWATGWMHNRVRMIAASFLTKHLLIDWRDGERWFWDTLVDADPANNPASWQWVAGTGADAAPYFRIFNPVIQGEKFDPDGAYTRAWIPELTKLPNKFIQRPWAAPKEILVEAGVALGKTYPNPMVDHAAARQRALAAFATLKDAD